MNSTRPVPQVSPRDFPRKNILDASFHYTPSFDTDIRRTFERIREQQALAKPLAERGVNVLRLEQVKKANAA